MRKHYSGGKDEKHLRDCIAVKVNDLNTMHPRRAEDDPQSSTRPSSFYKKAAQGQDIQQQGRGKATRAFAKEAPTHNL